MSPQRPHTARITSALLALVAVLLTTTGCNDSEAKPAPSESSKSEQPDLPQAESGLVRTEALAELIADAEELPAPGAEGAIRVPSGTVTVESVSTVPTITDADTGAEQAPADGETFLIISWASDLDAGPPGEDPLPLPAISATGRTEPIVDLATANDGNGQFLISAAEDTDLLVTADGKDQHVALPESTRVADETTDALYNDPTDVSTDLTFKPITGNLDGEPFKITHSATVDTVHLTAWTPGKGWASDGNAWLVVTTTSSEGHDEKANPKVLPKETRQTWTLTVDDQQVGSPATLAVTTSDAPGEVVFEVPADTTAATLTAAAVTRYVDGTVFNGAVMTADHGTASVDLTLP